LDNLNELGGGLNDTATHSAESAPNIKARDIFDKCVAYTEPETVKAMGVYPYFRTIEAAHGNYVVCEGQKKIMIGSNNYLGLAHDPRVVEAAEAALRKYGSGCTGSRFLNGNVKIHEELEEALADFLKRESVLLFSTGFFANEGALATLLEEGDYILCDRENHASIIDGCKMSAAKTVPFAHNSPESLERRLKRLPAEGGKLLVVDGVFSMSGDITNLPELEKIARKYNARVYVDEAHALGVLGPNGEGAAAHFPNTKSDLIMGTFSKSLGSMGGFIAGPKEVIRYLKHKTRCFIFTAALAPAVSGGVLKALELIRKEPERRDHLWKNTRKMHEGFKSIGFDIGTTQTPIVPILIGSEKKAFLFTKQLYDAGIFTTPAIYPAVRYGESIVRTSYMATHTDEELDYVLEVFAKLGKELGIFEDAAYREKGKVRIPQNGYDLSLQDSEQLESI